MFMKSELGSWVMMLVVLLRQGGAEADLQAGGPARFCAALEPPLHDHGE